MRCYGPWFLKLTRGGVVLNKIKTHYKSNKEWISARAVCLELHHHIFNEPFDIVKFLNYVSILKSMNVDTVIGDIPISFQSNNQTIFKLIQEHGLKNIYSDSVQFSGDIKFIYDYESELFDRLNRCPWKSEYMQYEDINNVGGRLFTVQISEKFHMYNSLRLRDGDMSRYSGRYIVLTHDLIGGPRYPLYLCSTMDELDTFLLTVRK